MAKFKVEWSVEARLDLLDILEFYLKRNGTSLYSRKLNKLINEGIRLISKNPLIGVQSDISDARALITGDYQINYIVTSKAIIIVMLWDSRRNPEDKRVNH